MSGYFDAGDLVPDALVLSLIMDRIAAAEADGSCQGAKPAPRIDRVTAEREERR